MDFLKQLDSLSPFLVFGLFGLAVLILIRLPVIILAMRGIGTQSKPEPDEDKVTRTIAALTKLPGASLEIRQVGTAEPTYSITRDHVVLIKSRSLDAIIHYVDSVVDGDTDPDLLFGLLEQHPDITFHKATDAQVKNGAKMFALTANGECLRQSDDMAEIVAFMKAIAHNP